MKHQIISSCAMLLTCTMANAYTALWSWPVGALIIDNVNTESEKWKYAYQIENTNYCVGDLSCAAVLSAPQDSGIAKPLNSYWLSIRAFAIPFFSDAGITHITDPTGWRHEIVTDNQFGLLNASTLIWRAIGDSDGIAPGLSLPGFSYVANFAAGKGPFSVTNALGSTYFGDPAIPLSPAAEAAGLSPVPEPVSLAMLLGGVIVSGLALATRRMPAVR